MIKLGGTRKRSQCILLPKKGGRTMRQARFSKFVAQFFGFIQNMSTQEFNTLNFDRFTQNQFRRESQILISYNLGTLYIGIKNQTATLSRKCLAASCNFSYEKANELRASCVLCKCVTRTCRGHTMRPLFPSRLCKMRGPKNSPHRALRIAHARSWVTIDQVLSQR